MPPTHPNQEGRIESESFSFLNELARAFRSGESNPRPSHFPVLEGIRAVLAHLTAAGRLTPAGGMALTAEQVEDVRTVANNSPMEIYDAKERGLYYAAAARLRALFPATEPAEHVHEQGAHYTKAGTWTVSTCRTCGVVIERGSEDGAWVESTDPPAPAEPAEEETKAEVVQDIEVMQWDGTRKSIQAICDWVNSFDDELDDPTISYCFSSAAPDDVLDVSLTTNEGDFVRVSDGDFIVRDTQGNFYRRDRNAYATVAASSPVVPAPTETGTNTAGLTDKYIVRRVDGSDAEGGRNFGRRYFVLSYDSDPHARAALAAYAESCATDHPELAADLRARLGKKEAPAPAPTETGPWKTWEAAPDDVWFTSASAVGFLPAHRKRGSLVDWQFRDGSVGVYDVSQTWNAKLMARAPFVAAEEGWA